MEPVRLVLIDDHRVVRRGLRSFLEAFPDIVIVGEASSGEEALEKIEGWLPDVAVMDLLMPGGIDGIEASRRIRSITPHTEVVVLTAHSDDARVVAALRAGAIGYLRKDAEPEILLAAVRAAARGQSVLDPAMAGSVLQDLVSSAEVGSDLTERETEVLRLLAHGRTNREIAEELVVGLETVKTHVGNILAKLHLAHRTQAAIHALKQGLISLDEIEL
ncbi:MAG: response regulator transcription factor [Anaerolineae bacterium]|nr:MAG: response regulator transcription factor [Anaerolineae bacterium]